MRRVLRIAAARIAATAAALLLVALLPATVTAQSDVQRQITPIADGLYRFQNQFHFSVFLVTDDGVLVTDPINADAAAWLKAQVRERFGRPIRYLVYSHWHADHISGGEVFAEPGVEIVAHENTARNIRDHNIPTAMPTRTFSDTLTLTLGGERIELLHLGKNHSDDMIVMHFPRQRALFTVDFISVKRLPFRTLRGAFFPDWMDSIDRVAAMDFDILVPGHGALGSRQDAIDHGRYLQELYDGVKAGKAAGKSVAELQAELTLDAYADWGQYDSWRIENIQGMYGHVD